ncbi:TPD1 protein homolog 1 [Vitis vinifera]|uniref:TPD1 protein homolog 1 n=1 Tax=Vitis vinifera TaxID=29760 RepID=UPI00019860B8|nr:TPD1 protein homolog 1 [Vitis vinifera]
MSHDLKPADTLVEACAMPKNAATPLALLAILLPLKIDSSNVLELSSSSEKIGDIGIKKLFLSKENSTGFVRKLLASPDEGGAMNRIGGTCSKDNIVIFQGPTTPLPSGIPTYTVQILNVCVAGCSISNIHVRCGWFSSARLINPRLFRRIFFDDCLVNNGDALGPGESLSFQYANSFRYPLSVLSVSCF